MSVSEYISVFVALVLGLAVAELGTSFHHLMRARDRVQWDWISLALALFMLLTVVATWWAAYGWYRNRTTIEVVEFLPDLAILLLTYLAAAAVLPDEVPAEGIDLREFYLRTASYFWALNALLLLLIIIALGPRYAGSTDPIAIMKLEADNLIILAIVIGLIFVRRPWFDGIAVTAIVGWTIWGYLSAAITLRVA